MQKGKSGIGSHKHGVSGRAGKSPKLRHALKREAEPNSIKDRSKTEDPKDTIRELFHRDGSKS
jgi:hypothetical protein